MKKVISLLLTITLVFSLSVTCFAAANIAVAPVGTYTESDEAQDITIRLSVPGLTEPYCGFYVDGGVTVPAGFTIKSYSTSYEAQPMDAGSYNAKNGKLNYEQEELADLIPADTYYDLIVTAPANAKGQFDIVFKNVVVANQYGVNELASVATITAKVTIAVPVTGVSLDKTSLTLEVGQTDTLVATVAPNEATNKNVTWSSNNAAVEVDQDGKVTAESIIEEAVITVTTEDGGKAATCKVKVVAATCKHTGGSKHYEAKAANCKVGGNIEYWECNDCKAKFSDEALTSSVADVATPIDPNKHGEKTHYDAKPATCKVGGNIEYWECNDCKVKFSDEALNTPVDVVATPVDPNAHGSFVEGGEHLKAGATCTTNEFYYKVCERCGAAHATETWEKTATKLGHDMAPADCLNPATCKRNCGYTEGVKLGHDFANGEYGMNATQHWKICARTGCEEKDTAVDHSFVDKICTVCDYDANCKHDGTKTTHSAVASTCTVQGNNQYVTCDKCGAVTEGIDALLPLDLTNHTGHSTKPGANKADPTCFTDGNTGDILCDGCDTVLQVGTVIPKQHTLTKHTGTVATCMNTGVVDTWECSGECGKTYIDEAATVEANEVNIVIPKDADNHVGGDMQYDQHKHWGQCACGTAIDEEAHKGGAATCSAKAVCSVCAQPYGALDATAHIWTDGVCENNAKHIQVVKKAGSKVEEEIAGLPNGAVNVKQLVDGVLVDVDLAALFRDGIKAEGGKLIYDLQSSAPVGEYYAEIGTYVVAIIVEQENYDYNRPVRPTLAPEAVNDAMNLIDELPSARKVTLADQKDIEAARKAYDALSKANQAKVTNYDDLVAAEEALAALMAAPEMPEIDNPFVDVDEDAYYADAVLWAIENGITSGTSTDTFSPNAVCTRAQVVTFLWRAAGCPAPLTAGMPFADVEAGAYYSAAVQWAVENNITAGMSADAFGPNGECTRAQIVTFLWRAQGNPAFAVGGSFADVEAESYYTAPVQWAVANGITNGTSDTTFGPAEDCTRAQVVTFLYRCMAE